MLVEIQVTLCHLQEWVVTYLIYFLSKIHGFLELGERQ